MTNQEAASLFPGLYYCADKAAQKAKKRYLLGIGGYLIILIMASINAFFLSGYVLDKADFSVSALISLIFFTSSLAINTFLAVKKPEDEWYKARAIAESVKTMSWRWMMRAEPYQADDIKEVSKYFMSEISKIRKNSKISEIIIIDSIERNLIITEKMKQIRAMALTERFNFYKENRVEDQEKWYLEKANYNKKRSKLWFGLVVILHIAAIALIFCKINVIDANLPVNTIALCAIAALGWIQAKSFRELSAAYSSTAVDISLIKEDAALQDVKKEEVLSAFVIDSENAFSKEHTNWTSKKTSKITMIG